MYSCENNNTERRRQKELFVIVTAGATYLDIDAYACMVATEELLRLQGVNAIAYSDASCNYSVCSSLQNANQIHNDLPSDCLPENSEFIIVDVSDPTYLEKSVPLDRVIAVYDHHAGFEDYWTSRIGDNAHIEFIGAAATLIWREWKKAGLADKMSNTTVRLLAAAILDNTLNLMSANTTDEDRETFAELCKLGGIDGAWCASYFSEVQKSIEADLKNALLGDVKTVWDSTVLPAHIGQLAVWDSEKILCRLPEIRRLFDERFPCWMLNIIDIGKRFSCFVCSGDKYQNKLEKIFNLSVNGGVAKTSEPYLRKEIIKTARLYQQKMETAPAVQKEVDRKW